MPRSVTAIGIVLRTRNYREQDRWVDILTPDNGKVSVLAKGVRKISSRRASALQPGSLITFHWLSLGETKLLTEVRLEETFMPQKADLSLLRDLSAIFEIVFHISLEDIEQADLFVRTQEILRYLHKNPEEYQRGQVREALFALLAQQGIEAPAELEVVSVTDLMERIVGQPIRSFAYLQV